MASAQEDQEGHATLGFPLSVKETRVVSDFERLWPRFPRSFAFALRLLQAKSEAVGFNSHLPGKITVEILFRHNRTALSIIGFSQETLTDWPICPSVKVLIRCLVLLFVSRCPPC